MVFVIAEIGINHNGSLDIAKKLIDMAKNAHCDAVKFQSFTESTVESHPEKNRLVKASISEDNVKQIDQLAKESKIEWFCTPMYPEAVTLLDPYVKRYKIRVKDGKPLFEKSSSPLLDQVLNTGKEVIISCEDDPSTIKIYENKNISKRKMTIPHSLRLRNVSASRLRRQCLLCRSDDCTGSQLKPMCLTGRDSRVHCSVSRKYALQ